MMSEAVIDRTISEIDAALAACAPDAPVSLGVELFAALVRRGLICDHLPAPMGGEGSTEALHPSAYRETHPARVDTHLADFGFAFAAGAREG